MAKYYLSISGMGPFFLKKYKKTTALKVSVSFTK